MDQDRDLLPWILGGLMMATVALAIAVGSTNKIAAGNLPALSEPAIRTLPAAQPAAQPVAQSAALPAIVPAPASALAAPPAASVPIQATTPAPPTEPTVKIWECTINGLRTFSNRSCGDNPSVREIGPVNTMESTPIYRFDRSYAPESNYQPDYPSPQESPDSSYPVVVGIPYYRGRKPDHAHQPHGRNHGPSPRKN
jgi:hypothetical protein